MESAIFSYKIADLLEEVTKRTSYFGKMRGTEDEPYLLDRMSLTSGENFLFTEFLDDAVAQTYDWIKAFGRNISGANQMDRDYSDKLLYKDFGLKTTINNVLQPVGEFFKVNGVTATKDESGGGSIEGDLYVSSGSVANDTLSLTGTVDATGYVTEGSSTTTTSTGGGSVVGDLLVLDGSVDDNNNIVVSGSVDASGNLVVESGSAGDIIVTFPHPITFEAKEGLIYKYKAIYTIRTILGGAIEHSETREQESANLTLAKDGTATYNGIGRITDFVWTESTGMTHVLQGVEVEILVTAIQPATVESVAQNTYIEYHNDLMNTDTYEVWQAYAACTTANWLEYSYKLPADPRDSVMFAMEMTPAFDKNQISSIDRYIKEALVCYVLYRWFEYTKSDEAESFFDKFEDYARKAQLGLNSETKIMQRRYSWI